MTGRVKMANNKLQITNFKLKINIKTHIQNPKQRSHAFIFEQNRRVLSIFCTLDKFTHNWHLLFRNSIDIWKLALKIL